MAYSLINRTIKGIVNDNINKPPEKPRIGAACNLDLSQD